MTDSIQSLYKSLLRYAHQFPQYNYRNYALRKIKEDFSAAKSLKTSEELNKFVKEEQEALEQLKRMIKVQTVYFYESSKLILEQGKKEPSN